MGRITNTELRAVLTDRIAALEERIEAACSRAGRRRDEITVVAVTKTVSADIAGLLPELGIGDLGESRPQILWEKAAAITGPVRWHQIGHLQRNKAERTVPIVERVHSADSVRLLETLAKESAKRRGTPLPLLLEINMTGEAAKHGFAPDEVVGIPRELITHPSLHVDGLMTMAAYSDDPEDSRPAFRGLRELRDRLQVEWSLPLPHLSMGMSGDFEVGIEEGATFIRPGTVLFDGLDAD